MNVLFLKQSQRSEPRKKLLRPSLSKNQLKMQPLVLIVESHADTRLMLKQVLAIWNCRAVEAEYGEEAVALAKQMQPDLILMNIGFPPFDGIEATRRIRRTPALQNTPIILLSSHAAPAYCQTALAAGGNEYLVKPYELTALKTAIDRQLSFSDGDKI